MSPAPKKKSRCVECRYCGYKTDPKQETTKRFCTHCRRSLPHNVASRPACASFVSAKKPGYWGP